jgi:hypothetical protein
MMSDVQVLHQQWSVHLVEIHRLPDQFQVLHLFAKINVLYIP